MTENLTDQVFRAAVAHPDAEGGLDSNALAQEPGNFLRHVIALSSSKLADGLINPKLVLSWLLTSLGAGAFWAGMLVPVRESLALLPQILSAPPSRHSLGVNGFGPQAPWCRGWQHWASHWPR